MKNYRKYRLETYTGQNSRHSCPKCGDKHSFTYYVDIETGEPFDYHVGRCNHESSCGYHKLPIYIYGDDMEINWKRGLESWNHKPQPPIPISYFDKKYLIESEKNHHDNNFICFLLSIFEYDLVFNAIELYHVGTSDYLKGGVIFWYLDSRNHVCSGKVMKYDKETGKRLKTNSVPIINSMRSILIKKGLIDTNFNQKSCLFGEHLLCNRDKKVCIVESEKTAIIASINYPEYIWLAAGGRSFLTDERVKILKGRDVTLYPDNDAYDLWHAKASNYHFKISSIVRENLNNPNDDLADFILSKI